MNALLNNVLVAHGGLDRWRSFKVLEATIITGGEFWAMKGIEQDSMSRQMTVWTGQERSSVGSFGNPDWHTEFTPDRIAIVTRDGSIIAERDAPRDAFAGHEMMTPWDPLHRAYFNGYALWTYLSTPFLLASPRVSVEEIEPWNEAGEVWRVLRASFPSDIATHSAQQDFYFGEDMLLRRHDYNVDVGGGFAAAHLVSDFVEAGGIRLPTTRRAYQRGADHRPIIDPVMVSIDISDVRFS